MPTLAGIPRSDTGKSLRTKSACSSQSDHRTEMMQRDLSRRRDRSEAIDAILVQISLNRPGFGKRVTGIFRFARQRLILPALDNVNHRVTVDILTEPSDQFSFLVSAPAGTQNCKLRPRNCVIGPLKREEPGLVVLE